MTIHKITRRDLFRLGAVAGMGLAAGSLNRFVPAVLAENKQFFYKLNDVQEFIRGYNNNQFGIGYGRAWSVTKLGEPAMVANYLGGFPFQPGIVDDPVYIQMLDLSVHRLTKAERKLLDEKGSYIIDTAHRLGVVGQDFASSAFHVYPPDGFSRMEVALKLPRGIHETVVNGAKVITGIDNTFVGVWILPDLMRLSDDLAALQKYKGLSDLDASRIKRKFADVYVELDIVEAVGHSVINLSSIMTGVHLQGYQGQASNALYYDRIFFYNTATPKWLQFMIDNNAPFKWETDALNVVFEFDPDGHWRTYFNEIEMVNSKTVLEKAEAPQDESLRRIPIRTIATPVGPLTVSYFIVFNAAAGGLWPGQPTAPNDAARDGLSVANLLLR
jgi:hypothetical protein